MHKKDRDGLSPKEAEFCRRVSRGENPSQAYREVYKPKPSTKPESIWSSTSRLMRSDKVQSRLNSLQAQISAQFVNKTVTDAVKDKTLVLDTLRKIINEEVPTPDSGYIRSLELLGRTQALFSDHQIVNKEADLNSDDIAQQIADLLSKKPIEEPIEDDKLH
jgi:hypothetical protein